MSKKSFDKFDNISTLKKIQMSIIPLYCSLSSMVAGYFLVYFSMIEDEFNSYNGLAEEETQIYSDAVLALPIGALLGSFAYNRFVNAFGQNAAMKVLDVLAIVVVIPQLFTLSYPIVIICRLLMGFYCTITIGLVPAWIISLAPQQLSGIFGTFSYLAIATGLLQAYALGTQMDSATIDAQLKLKIFIGVPILMSLTHLLGLVLFGTDSIERLIQTRNQIKYTKVLRRIYGKQWARFQNEIRQFKITPVEFPVQGQVSTQAQKSAEKHHAIAIGFANQACGVFVLLEYSQQLFKQIEGEVLKADHILLILGGCQVIAVFLSGFLINRFGRRSMMLLGMALVSLFLFLGSISTLFVENHQQITVVLLFLYFIAYSVSLGPLFMIYAVEALLDLSLVLKTYWGIMAILTIFTQILIEYISYQSLMIVFFACSSISLVLFNNRMIETKGVPKKQIKELLNQRDFVWESSDILFGEKLKEQTQVEKTLEQI